MKQAKHPVQFCIKPDVGRIAAGIVGGDTAVVEDAVVDVTEEVGDF